MKLEQKRAIRGGKYFAIQTFRLPATDIHRDLFHFTLGVASLAGAGRPQGVQDKIQSAKIFLSGGVLGATFEFTAWIAMVTLSIIFN